MPYSLIDEGEGDVYRSRLSNRSNTVRKLHSRSLLSLEMSGEYQDAGELRAALNPEQEEQVHRRTRRGLQLCRHKTMCASADGRIAPWPATRWKATEE